MRRFAVSLLLTAAATARRNALIYLTYSDRVIEGSPQNAVTALAVDRSVVIPVKR